MNTTLNELFLADQAERQGSLAWSSEWREQIRASGRLRRAQVREFIAEGVLLDGEAYYQAAMIFQHGESLGEYRLARELALRAVGLGYYPARWRAAAALDRSLVGQGLPQKYGTQFEQIDGRFVLCAVDPATTDEERREWDVPVLAEASYWAEELDRLHAEPLAEGSL